MLARNFKHIIIVLLKTIFKAICLETMIITEKKNIADLSKLIYEIHQKLCAIFNKKINANLPIIYVLKLIMY